MLKMRQRLWQIWQKNPGKQNEHSLAIEVTGITGEQKHVLAEILADVKASVDRLARAARRWVGLSAISLNFGSPDSERTRSMAF